MRTAVLRHADYILHPPQINHCQLAHFHYHATPSQPPAAPPLRQAHGPSQRVRGNRPDAVGAAVRAGSIPACAGEPREQKRQISTLEVYPRVCGGTSPQGASHKSDAGLSPRVRGNLTAGCIAQIGRRSTPACAGTSPQGASHKSDAGLSPRVRGNPCCPPSLQRKPRSIPACAGEPC